MLQGSLPRGASDTDLHGKEDSGFTFGLSGRMCSYDFLGPIFASAKRKFHVR